MELKRSLLVTCGELHEDYAPAYRYVFRVFNCVDVDVDPLFANYCG
jgi:hypothetical protein